MTRVPTQRQRIPYFIIDMGRAVGLLNTIIADLSVGEVKPPLGAVPPPPETPPPAAPPAKSAAPPAQPTPTAAKPAVAAAKAAAAPQAKNAAAKAPPAAPAPAPTAGPSLPATEALYQTDTYLFTCKATVLAVTPLEAGGWAVMLDRTCFHPQGGGQPADTGTITSVEGGDPTPWSRRIQPASSLIPAP